MTEFTPLMSLAGGALIGLAAVALMGLLGRIAGINGILSGLIALPNSSDWAWRAAFVLGLLGSPLIVLMIAGTLPALSVPVSPIMIGIGGVLVGIGTSLGSGCTSGHGVCGIARLSKRSIAATLTFMATALITVFVIRHVIGA
ncbi:YeeE/YedE family protein [Roseibium suaedae]|uniref:Uncharacterized protein n=1 Tax=Roseibium suaedae TaxID=735517 RepID=A0A1M6Z4B8_9HYPH|nr:hypothetical protein SAMN05444272_0128 [Roseibium suaedae]